MKYLYKNLPVQSGTHSNYGIMIHTTGRGVLNKAKRWGTNPLDAALRIYSSMDEGPHYVIGPKGVIAQLRPTTAVTWHCGLSRVERRSYLDGHWEHDLNRIDQGFVEHWIARWRPQYKSPSHLYPSKRPNLDYVGIELIPDSKGLFSLRQYIACAEHCVRVGQAIGLGTKGHWWKTGRLVGHEDVNPYRRPGWDPGVYNGKFNWEDFRTMVEVIAL